MKISNIVLVDDEPFINAIHQKLIKKYWHELKLTAFFEPAKALEFIQVTPPDLIMLDINMPGINGFEFLRQMQNKQLDTTVVVVSSSIDPDENALALSYPNVKKFLRKPLTYDQLKGILQGW